MQRVPVEARLWLGMPALHNHCLLAAVPFGQFHCPVSTSVSSVVVICVSVLRLQYEREAALKDFSAGTVRVLIATDVASRGLDVKDVGHVINMDLPRAFEDYVHRIGGLQGLSSVALVDACK
jgi:hypothetical protein